LKEVREVREATKELHKSEAGMVKALVTKSECKRISKVDSGVEAYQEPSYGPKHRACEIVYFTAKNCWELPGLNIWKGWKQVETHNCGVGSYHTLLLCFELSRLALPCQPNPLGSRNLLLTLRVVYSHSCAQHAKPGMSHQQVKRKEA